jgi:hypothetical protein
MMSYDLGTLVPYCVDTDSKSRLEYLLNFAGIRGIALDFTGIKISELLLPTVLDFLWTHKQPIPHLTSTSDLVIVCSPASHLNELLAKEKIRRKQMFALCKAVKFFREDVPEIFAFLKKMLKMDGPKLFTASLILAAEVFQQFKVIPSNFPDFLFEALQHRIDSLPPIPTMSCLLSLSKKTKFNDAQCEFVRVLSGICGFLSHEFSLFIATLISINSQNAIATIAEIPFQYFESTRPSHFIDGLRILNQCVYSVGSGHVVGAVESSIRKIIHKSKKFVHIQPINFAVTNFLRGVLVREIPALTEKVVSRAAELLYGADFPCFGEYSMLASSLIGPGGPPPLVAFAEQLLERPINFWTFRVALQILKARLARTESPEAELQTRLDQFVRNLVEFDCYEIRECFVLWIELLKEHVGLEQTLRVVVNRFFDQSKRFFPVICAFVKEIRERKDEEVCHRAIQSAMAAEKSHTRICAFDMLNGEPPMREVLDIALLETESIWFVN